MPRPAGWRPAICDALFLDIPYIVDSFCRHADYQLNRLHRYPVGLAGGSAPIPRSLVTLPAFALLAVVLVFVAYGATLSSLCGVFGATYATQLRHGFGYACIAAAIALYVFAAFDVHRRVAKRFLKQRVRNGRRRAVVYGVLYFLAFAYGTPVWLFGRAMLSDGTFETCHPASPPASKAQLAILVAALLIVGLGAGKSRSTRARMTWQVGILALMVAAVWLLPGSATATEASQMPYRNVYAVIAIAMGLTALLATALIHVPFASMHAAERDVFRDALPERELFDESRSDPPLSARRILGGAVIGILQKPLQFLLLPAFAIILVPSGFVWHACLFGTIASVLLLIASNLTPRWDQLSAYARRYFLLGTPLVVSGAVIVIAALRLADVQYAATILNVAPFGVLFAWMVMAYALCWWFESQVNSVLATELLGILAPGDRTDTKVVAYVPGARFENPYPKVERRDRYLLAHPIGQFVVVGWFRDRDTLRPTRAFNILGFVELFSKLAEKRNPEAARETERRVQLYFALVNITLLIGAGLLWWHFGQDDRDNTVAPVVVARQGDGQHNLDLASLLLAGEGSSRPAIVVAASGGGTRAALYTAAALQGLHRIGADRDIVLLSGVSGGAVAAAYFFAHRDTLVDASARECGPGNGAARDPWDCFLDRMAEPFIDDVLRGATEWRIQSEQPLGVLLTESFARRLVADGRRYLDGERGPGLILNTTITGQPVQDSPMLNGALVRGPKPRSAKCEDFERPVAALAGGRLAFSNLRVTEAGTSFQARSDSAPNLQLPFVVVRDDTVELARAAALSANFPPVFPNARVNLTGYPADAYGCTVRSYFVTDGGAVENLGLVSALLALEDALRSMHANARLRDIAIVMVEASAFNYDYEQDRGVGAATDESKERLTGRLTLELLQRVQAAAAAIDPRSKVLVYDLSLPRLFRSRGGLGTHWMFPENVRVTTPLASPLPAKWREVLAQYSHSDRYWVTLDKDQLVDLWQAIFAPSTSFCSLHWYEDPARDLTTVSNWMCGRRADGTAAALGDVTLANWETARKDLRVQP